MSNWRNLVAGVQEHAIGVFGTPALYRVDGAGLGVSISGVFRDQGTTSNVELEVDLATVAPEFHVRQSDLPAGALDGEADTLELEETGVVYRIHDSEPDGEGLTVFVLTREDAL